MPWFLKFMLRFIGSLTLVALIGTMGWNTYTNFMMGDYAAAAPASSSFIVAVVWPLILVTAAFAGLYYIWRKEP